jgi:hypothetical protein
MSIVSEPECSHNVPDCDKSNRDTLLATDNQEQCIATLQTTLHPIIYLPPILRSKMTSSELPILQTKLLEEPCLIICLLEAIAVLQKKLRKGAEIVGACARCCSDTCTHIPALHDVRASFIDIIDTVFNYLKIPSDDDALLTLLEDSLDYFQQSFDEVSGAYCIIKTFYDELRADSAQDSIARLTSPDMHDQLQATIKQLLGPSMSAFLIQLNAFYESMPHEWLVGVINEQSSRFCEILDLHVQGRFASLGADHLYPGGLDHWYSKLLGGISFNLYILVQRLQVREGRVHDCDIVATQTPLDRFYSIVSVMCFPHKLPMLDDYDTSLHDPRDDPRDSGYQPQSCENEDDGDSLQSDEDEEDEDEEDEDDQQDEPEDVVRDDVYTFMLSVDQKTSELTNSGTS